MKKSIDNFILFRRNTSKYNLDGDFSPSFLLNSFKDSMVMEKIQNRADSVQLGQVDTFTCFSRDQCSLGAEQSDNLGNRALGALECAQFLIVELAIIQFAVIEFHSGIPLSFSVGTLYHGHTEKSRTIFRKFRRDTSK